MAADAADHTWGEWYDGTYQEGEDGEIQNVKIRICSDCGVLQLEDGTVLTPSTDEKLEIVDPDEPEQLAPGVNLDGNYDDQIAPCDSVGIHDGAHSLTIQELRTLKYGIAALHVRKQDPLLLDVSSGGM